MASSHYSRNKSSEICGTVAGLAHMEPSTTRSLQGTSLWSGHFSLHLPASLCPSWVLVLQFPEDARLGCPMGLGLCPSFHLIRAFPSLWWSCLLFDVPLQLFAGYSHPKTYWDEVRPARMAYPSSIMHGISVGSDSNDTGPSAGTGRST